MKWLVGILLFLNIGLWAYFNQALFMPQIPQVKQPELSPEKIRILKPEEVASLPKKTPAEPEPAVAPVPVVTACYEWGVFSGASIANAQAAIANLSLRAEIKEQTSKEAKRFWVFRPPLKSAEEAHAKAEELAALGIDELFVVQEPKWRNAISFGVFEDEQLATNLLRELKAKGVKEVVKALRSQSKSNASLRFDGLTDAQVAELEKLKPDFPQAELKKTSCS
jgi:hypothetical protein